MKKVYYLSTCSTCIRILKELNLDPAIPLQDIKTEKISPEQLDQMKALSGSYESLFSRRALKFRGMGLHEKDLNESDYRDLILSEYTFLKRPVMLWDEQIFIGNSKKTVESIKRLLS